MTYRVRGGDATAHGAPGRARDVGAVLLGGLLHPEWSEAGRLALQARVFAAVVAAHWRALAVCEGETPATPAELSRRSP